MKRISRPAIASPRTYLLAPSIEPKNSASSPTSARRRLASFSSISPAFMSASIAICLPGMAARGKRAAALGDPLRALGDDDEVDDDEDREDDQADREVAADQEVAERLD